MRAIRSRLAAFVRAEDAVSAIEFSLVMPILLALLFGGTQLTLYINATRKVQKIATSVSEMLSQAAPAVSTATTASVTAADLDFGYDATLVLFPYVMADAKRQGIPWRSDLTVSMAGISFKQNTNICIGSDLSGCYDANVDWTSTGTSNNAYRPCKVVAPQIPVDNSSPYSRTSLPRSLYGAGSVVAVDVTFTFNPTFGSSFLKPLIITRSAFVQPRYVQTITFDATNSDGIATTCPSTS